MAETVRVLNIDDDEVARYVKHRILAGAGYQVIDARDGREALRALHADRPHVALVDMKLPDMSGFELTRRLREDPAARSLRVIQVSAVCLTRDDERDGLDSGADAYLTVPFESEQLIALVGEIAPRGPGEPLGDMLPQARVRRVEAYMRANLHRQVLLDDLARAAGLSPFYFSRMFKAVTGTTPHERLMDLRIENAAKLLERTSLPLSEIAIRSGFRTQAHFSAAFRRRKASTPRDWRRASASA